MDTFDIEILDDIAPENKDAVQLPVNIIKIGEIDADDVRIYIHQDVYKDMLNYAASDISTELGGVLVGNHVNDLNTVSVIISGYIKARYTDASAASLTFTHETWNDIYRELDQNYSGKRIVGWQHTHPDYGIFLSGFDLFIQENYFREPYQVAYVIDPVQNENGFFQWKNGNIQKAGGYYIYDDTGIKISIPREESPKCRKSKGRKKLRIFLIALLAVLLLSAIAGMIIHWNRIFGNSNGIQTENDTDLVTQQEITVKDKLIG